MVKYDGRTNDTQKPTKTRNLNVTRGDGNRQQHSEAEEAGIQWVQ
jgi:hypothetical protein